MEKAEQPVPQLAANPGLSSSFNLFCMCPLSEFEPCAPPSEPGIFDSLIQDAEGSEQLNRAGGTQVTKLGGCTHGRQAVPDQLVTLCKTQSLVGLDRSTPR